MEQARGPESGPWWGEAYGGAKRRIHLVEGAVEIETPCVCHGKVLQKAEVRSPDPLDNLLASRAEEENIRDALPLL